MTKPHSLAVIAAQTKARAGKDRQRPDKPARSEPTPEQHRHADYVEQDIVNVTARGRLTIGKAFRRQPKFERIEGLGTEQLKALRHYRSTFDASEISETRCALDVQPRSAGGGALLTAIESKAFARARLRGIERELGATVHTLRAIALMDHTFSEVAMARYGSREVDYIDVGKGNRKPRTVIKMAPRSSTHRQLIRDEFFAGVRLLVDAVEPYLRGC